MRVILLMGLPGSGKTTHRKQLMEKNFNFAYVNQDQMGTNDRCIEYARTYLNTCHDLIIDRTNIDKYQRAKWIRFLKTFPKVDKIDCIYFKADPSKCIKRIQDRENHETISQNTPLQKIRKIVYSFYRSLEQPTYDEGFSSITIIDVDPSLESNQGYVYRYWRRFISLFNFFTRKRTK